MGSLSDYTENALLDHFLKVSSFSQPSNIYIALSTTDPLDDGSGITEPTGNGYARILCNSWSAASGRQKSNSASASIPTPTGSWGTIAYVALFDALSGGNMLAHGALSSPKTIGIGSELTFDPGSIVVSFNSGAISTYLANKLLDHLLKGSSYSAPANIYAGYALGSMTDAMSGSTVVEPTDSAYARQVHNNWNAASGGASDNNGAITFAQATEDQGSITYNFLADALTGGNILIYAAVSYTISLGDDPSIADGGMDITLS